MPILVLIFVFILCACTPGLPSPPHDGCGEGDPPVDDEAVPFVVRFEPGAEPEAVPPAVRLHVLSDAEAPAEAWVLVRGEVGSAHLGQLARGEPSGALTERMVEVLRWRDPDGVVLAPLRPLPPGAYAVASGEPRGAVAFEVIDEGPPSLGFVFPREGYQGALLGVWCADEPLPAVPPRLRLAPSDREVAAVAGLSDAGDEPRCLRLQGGPSATVELPPLSFDAAGVTWPLEPHPLAAHDGPVSVEPGPACEPSHHAVAAGCLDVEDDRVALWPRRPGVLWSVVADGEPLGLPFVPPAWTRDDTRFWLGPLPPDTPLTLRVLSLDARGETRIGMLGVTTQPARAHLVITEVMANPVGPEPAQEWVELYNDGLAAASLGDYRLLDPAGGAPLPDAWVPPGAYAVIARQDYDPASLYDPPLADDAILVLVEELVENGLANGGEPLALEHDGRIVSQFPPLPKPKAGHSVERVDPKAHFHDPHAFRRTETPTPGGPPADPP